MDRKTTYTEEHFSLTHTVTSGAIPVHSHNDYVLSYYFGGRALCRFGKVRSFELRPGDLALLNPYQVHEDLASAERDYLAINFKKNFIPELIPDIAAKVDWALYFGSPRVRADAVVRRIFEVLRDEMRYQEFGRKAMIRSLVTELIVGAFRHYNSFLKQTVRLSPDLPVANWRIRKALDYLHSTYNQPFDLSRIAAVAGLSRFYLDRAFKDATGLSPHEYARVLRIEKAKDLLVSTSKPVSEIALEVGFSDQSHFSNAFKHFTGFTPSAYRLGTV